MRVLHVIPSVSAIHGGPSMAIGMMEQALGDRGILVETATTDDDGPGSRLSVPLGEPVLHGKAIRWHFRKDTEFYKASWSLLSWLFREVRRFDVVHIHALFSFASVAAAWVARRADIPYILRPLGLLNRYGLDERRPYLKRLSVRCIEGPLLRNAAAVHFTSTAERDEALAMGIAMASVVIPLGIEPTRAGDASRLAERLPRIRGNDRLLFLSRIDPKKNLEGLIRALGHLRRANIQPVLLVGGSGDETYVQTLKSVASAEGVAQQIEWLGHISGDMKADVLAAADVFVLPSFSENFGIAVVEAMAAGLPCVIGRGVALSREVQDAGAGVAVDPDPESIAAGIQHFIDSRQMRATAGNAARQLVQRQYSLDRMGSQLQELYSRILKQEKVSSP